MTVFENPPNLFLWKAGRNYIWLSRCPSYMITFCGVPRKNTMCSHLAIKKSIHSRTKLIFWQKNIIFLCKFEAEVTVPRYLQQTMSQLDPLQESHTTSNEVRAAQPSCEAEWIVWLCYEWKWIARPSPGLLQGWRGRDPAFPKSTLVPEMRWTDPKPTHNMLETHLARGWVL